MEQLQSSVKRPTGYVLDTSVILPRLISDLAKMYNCDYDIDELITRAMAAVEIRDAAEVAIIQEVQTTKRFFHIPLIVRSRDSDDSVRRNAMHDCDVLTTAWLNFAMGLFGIYRTHNIWDEDGVARMYYKRKLGNDILLCRFPDN